MLLHPNKPHHADDVERLRILALGNEERAALRRESMTIINAIRSELRRRAGW